MQVDKKKEYIINEYTYKNFVNLKESILIQILDWRNHQDVRRYMYNSNQISLSDHKNFIKSLYQRDDVYYWLVYKKNTPIGVVNLTGVYQEESLAELGYYIISDYQNRGIGLDFAYSNFCFAFNVIGCETVVGGIHPDNRSAILLDTYLGCVMGDMNSLKKVNSQDFISWKLTKEDFISNSGDKNDFRKFVIFLKNNC